MALIIPPPPKEFPLVCSGKYDSAPAFLLRTEADTLQRMEVLSGEDGAFASRYIDVSDDELRLICQAGISIAEMPKPSVSDLKAITPQSTVPASFTITGITVPGYTAILGNFWVPKNMPSTHNAHLSQFTVTQSGFDTNFSNSMHLYTC